MNYIDDTLNPKERVIYRTRLHWTTILPGSLAGLCLDVLSVILLVRMFQERGDRSGVSGLYAGAAVVFLTVSAVMYLAVAVKWNTAAFAVTDRRVLMRTGITDRRSIELPLEEVAAVTVDQSNLGRILGFGSIEVLAKNGIKEKFERVSAPQRLREETERSKNIASAHA